jgi:hypothetical protein
VILDHPPREEVVMSDTASASTYWREDDARDVLNEWRASGLSMAAFCRAHGLKVKRLERWHRRLRDDQQPDETRFVSFAMEPSVVSPQPICMLLGEVRVEIPPGFHEETLLRLVRVLSC